MYRIFNKTFSLRPGRTVASMAAAAIIVAAGCTKQSLETTYSRQEDRIDSFITSQLENNSSYSVVHNHGSNRLIISGGNGNALEPGDTLTFQYAGYVFSGSSLSASDLFATNNRTIAEEAGWNLTDADFSDKRVILDEDELLEGLYYGLEGVRSGEECIVIFSGKYGYGNRHVGTIPANSALAYHIWVKNVSE